MKKLIIMAVLAAATPALASQLAVGTNVGKTASAARQALTKMGFDVRKSEMERGRIELYVVKNDMRREVYVDPASGNIQRIKVK